MYESVLSLSLPFPSFLPPSLSLQYPSELCIWWDPEQPESDGVQHSDWEPHLCLQLHAAKEDQEKLGQESQWGESNLLNLKVANFCGYYYVHVHILFLILYPLIFYYVHYRALELSTLYHLHVYNAKSQKKCTSSCHLKVNKILK